MPTVDADLLARLRRRAEPEQPCTCPYCGGAPMLPIGPAPIVPGSVRWRCPRCDKSWVGLSGDPDLLALLTTYEVMVRGKGEG